MNRSGGTGLTLGSWRRHKSEKESNLKESLKVGRPEFDSRDAGLSGNKVSVQWAEWVFRADVQELQRKA
jgi:hypothetical protein